MLDPNLSTDGRIDRDYPIGITHGASEPFGCRPPNCVDKGKRQQEKKDREEQTSNNAKDPQANIENV